MPVTPIYFGDSKPKVAGKIAIEAGQKYRALLKGDYYKKGEVVTVERVTRDKITFMAAKASVSMVPSDFIMRFEKV